ncbi:hypothetical protein T4B_5414, partial [Trichinella pseudospiralis]
MPQEGILSKFSENHRLRNIGSAHNFKTNAPY